MINFELEIEKLNVYINVLDQEKNIKNIEISYISMTYNENLSLKIGSTVQNCLIHLVLSNY